MRDALEIAQDLLNIDGHKPLTVDEHATIIEAFTMLQRLHNTIIDIVRITKEERARLKAGEYPLAPLSTMEAVEMLGKHLSTSPHPRDEAALERKDP